MGPRQRRQGTVAWACLINNALKAKVAVQEVIIQNFRAKKGTAMAAAAEPPLEELLWTVALARIILGPAANIQVSDQLRSQGRSRCDMRTNHL
jgi:2-iminoacetate synthase ThiH